MKNMEERQVTKAEVRRRTAIAFLVFFLLAGAGYWGWRQIGRSEQVSQAAKPLRAGFKFNESVFGTQFDPDRRVKEFPKGMAVKKVRVNGGEGLSGAVDTAWRMRLVRRPGDTELVSLAQIRALPRTEIVFDFKCIEGWSQVTHWGGVSYRDFVKAFHLEQTYNEKYAGLVTPDKGYYVGIDMPSMMQAQTILCYEMNGEPLPLNQGFPLRLIIPVKYGIKHLKRIGTLYFSNERPPDFWAERGYDYYSGL